MQLSVELAAPRYSWPDNAILRQIREELPNPDKVYVMTMDGQGHDANQSSSLMKAAREPFEDLQLELFLDTIRTHCLSANIEELEYRLTKRIHCRDSIIAHKWKDWKAHASLKL